MLPTGQSYERRYLERWLAQGNSSCPTTGQQLEKPVKLTTNFALRKTIEEWAEAHVPWLLVRACCACLQWDKPADHLCRAAGR